MVATEFSFYYFPLILKLLPFKSGQNKGNIKPETCVSKFTEYRKKNI